MKTLNFCADYWKDGTGFQIRDSIYNTLQVEDDYELTDDDIDTENIEAYFDTEYDDVFIHTDLINGSGVVLRSVGMWVSEYKEKSNL